MFSQKRGVAANATIEPSIPGAAGIGSQVVANGARGLATGTAATAEVSALAPAGADEISAMRPWCSPSEGIQTLGINALAQEEMARAGATVIADRGHVRGRRRRQRRRPGLSQDRSIHRVDRAMAGARVYPSHRSGRAFPPEINTSRLQAGAGAAPMMQAAAGWEALAISLETQADELAASLASLARCGRAWRASAPSRRRCRWLSGSGCCRCRRRNARCRRPRRPPPGRRRRRRRRSCRRSRRTTSRTRCSTRRTSSAINTVPIGLNEADYVRMWDQAAAVMSAYEAETMLNSTFEPVSPPKPIVLPGGAEAAMAGRGERGPDDGRRGGPRNAMFAKVSAIGKARGGQPEGGPLEQAQSRPRAVLIRRPSRQATSQVSRMQMLQQGHDAGHADGRSQLGSTLGQLPQQLMQGVTQPFQQLTQPLQQVSSLFGQMGGIRAATRVLRSACWEPSPFSNHPAIGGTGASSGFGHGTGRVAARRRRHIRAHAVDVESGRHGAAAHDDAGSGGGGCRRGCGRRAGWHRSAAGSWVAVRWECWASAAKSGGTRPG